MNKESDWMVFNLYLMTHTQRERVCEINVAINSCSYHLELTLTMKSGGVRGVRGFIDLQKEGEEL